MLVQLVKKVLAQYRLDVDGVHGVRHRGRVLENGRRLAPLTGADLRVLELFVIFHDACRWRDSLDHDHGHRAAARNPVILGWAGTWALYDEIPPVCADEWGL